MLHRKQSSHSRPTAKCPNHAFCPPHLHHHIGRFRKKSGHGIVEIGTREVLYSAAATARAINSLAPIHHFLPGTPSFSFDVEFRDHGEHTVDVQLAVSNNLLDLSLLLQISQTSPRQRSVDL
jgi:hypothetical protein